MKQIKEIFKIGVPIMLGQACVIIVAFADNIMIGWHNVDELAAASFVNNVLNLIILMGLGFSTGLTPMIGAFNGVNDVKSIGSTMKNGILVNGAIGLVSLLVLSVIYCFLDSFGQAPELLPLIRPYFIIVGISSFFQLGFNVLKQFTDGMRKPEVAMTFLMIGNVINILGNWVLIYGKFGFPELGLNGAGLSTLLARALMLIMFALYVFKGRKFREHMMAFKASRLSKVRMSHIFNLGYPVAIQTGLEASTFSFSAIMIGWLGVVELAAHQVMTTISLLFFLLLQGLSFAVTILVSNSYGKNDLEGVRKYATKGFLMMLSVSGTLSILFYIFRYQAAGIFTDSEEVASIAVSLMLLLFAYQFGDGLQLCYSCVLRGIQDVKPIMIGAFFSYYVVAIPCSYCLGFKAGLGIQGIWLGFPIGLTLAGIIFFFRFRHDMRRMSSGVAMK